MMRNTELSYLMNPYKIKFIMKIAFAASDLRSVSGGYDPILSFLSQWLRLRVCARCSGTRCLKRK